MEGDCLKKDLWVVAVKLLDEEDRLQIDFQTTGTTVQEVYAAAQEKKKECIRKRWRYTKKNGEVIILHDVFDKIASWVDKFKQIGDIAVQFDPVHASLPWAGIRFFLQIAVNVSQIFVAVLEGMEQIANLTGRYAIIEYLYRHRSSKAIDLLKQSIIKVYVVVLEYLAEAKRYFERNTLKRVLKNIAQTPESGFGMLLKKITDEQVNVDRHANLVGAEQLEWMQGDLRENNKLLGEILLDFSRPINRMRDQISDLHDNLEKSKRKEVLDWLSAVPYSKHHKNTQKDRLKGSGSWLLGRAEFREWRKSSASSVLWLHGILIDTLREDIPKNAQPEPLAYFYCDRGEAGGQRADPDEILRCIAKQLSCLKSGLPIREPVVRKYQELEEEDELDPLELQDTKELILSLTEDRPATIIIDALDECDPRRRHELLDALTEILRESTCLVKIFVSSRDDDDILCQLGEFPNLYVHANDNGDDIESFIKQEVGRAIDGRRLLRGNVSPELKDLIIDTLIGGAEGMFRWVSLQIQNLSDPRRMKVEGDVRKELGRLPKELKDIYDIIHEQIEDSGVDSCLIAKKALKWLLCAQKPLSTTEFIAAVYVDTDGEYASITHIQMLNMCCNLVVLDTELDIFRFAHLSVREYLEGRKDYKSDLTHAIAAERCLDVLLADTELTQPQTLRMNATLAQYATLYWAVHSESSRHARRKDRLAESFTQFLVQGWEATPSFERWILAVDSAYHSLRWNDSLEDKLRETICSPPTPLFAACVFGFVEVVEYLSRSDGVDFSRRNTASTATGLHLASRYGHLNVAKILLDKGAEVEARDRKGRTALYWAAGSGHKDVVLLLLDNQADISAKDDDGQTALHWAADWGHEVVARLMLEKGADVTARDNNGRTALHRAAGSGHRNVVGLMLEKGANVAAEDGCGRTPLHRAASHGHEAIVGLLLKKGADIHTKYSGGVTALHGAAGSGHVGVVKLLVDEGADVAAQDQYGQTALRYAQNMKREAVMQQLLKVAAGANNDGRTALHQAAYMGDKELVRLLLEKGADVTATDGDGMTALHWSACKGGDEAVVLLLLERGADIQAKYSGGGTALHRAARGGHEAVTKLLLAKGADRTMQNEEGLYPVHEAASEGHEALVALLLGGGADAGVRDTHGKTAMHAAARNGHLETINQLLGVGLDFDAKDNQGCSTLHHAASGGWYEIVKRILDAGGMPNDPDKAGWTPLHWASRSGKAKVIELLLERGGDRDLASVDGWTPLDIAAYCGHDAASLLRRRGSDGSATELSKDFS
ncbi:hypothetical protein GP486_005162, partial [Trichoglossum hirsutum]